MRLIDKDELFNSIFNELEDEEGCIHICKAGLLDDIDEFPEVNQWISVKDKLPPLDEEVLAFDEGEFYIVRYVGDGWQCSDCFFYDVDEFEYWMPLPKAPKERE